MALRGALRRTLRNAESAVQSPVAEDRGGFERFADIRTDSSQLRPYRAVSSIGGRVMR